ncbi:MAG: hypothetical protein ABJB74_08650, partial [Gemmatimonas sp.]
MTITPALCIHELLLPLVTSLQSQMRTHTMRTADAGYHSEANVRELHEQNIAALIADNAMRRRDERFATQARYQTAPPPLHNKTPNPVATGGFPPSAFTYDAA